MAFGCGRRRRAEGHLVNILLTTWSWRRSNVQSLHMNRPSPNPSMRRTIRGGKAVSAVTALAGLCFVVLGVAGVAAADGGAHWRYSPASAPPPPVGVAPAPYPVPLGAVGQISFWAPNRGLLITGGTAPSGPVAAGLYAYDGTGWHQLSTVCGGAQGRIAWAGPEEFWTIADQRAGQIKARQGTSLTGISLCHFLNGQVAGSYAMPLEQPNSYLEMDAAGCLSARDCWFAGKDGSGGSFHLHWDGGEVSAVYDADDHAVTGMTAYQGKLFEGLAIAPEDRYLEGENQKHPAVIRTIAPAAQTSLCNGVPSVFCDVFLFAGQPLPAYPEGVVPDLLGGFELATDGSPLGAGATQLWAGADPRNPATGGTHAPVTILRDSQGSWTQVVPAPDGSSSLPRGAYLSGSETARQTTQTTPVGSAIAPEPGTGDAWLSIGGLGGGSAQVVLLEANGTVAETDSLPGPQDPVGSRGEAGPIVCPAIHDCWMATNQSGQGGWLFHLTDGSQYPQDIDPNFAGVIAYRPPDASVPVIYPDVPPLDDSLANQQPPPAPIGTPEHPPAPPDRHKKRRALVLHVKSRFLHGRVLEISFMLTARAHVRLVGRRLSKVVARTREESLRPGRHKLSLSLDPAHWPTKLQFEATPIGAPAPSGGETSGSTSNNTVSTG